jgi:S-adenosylmethionine-diacylgycerolhomoserine-N-methlytransferase
MAKSTSSVYPELKKLAAESQTATQEQDQNSRMQNYYQLQSRIYDLTRWTFLFGRKEIIRRLPFDRNAAVSILEVGCGTGFNLRRLAAHFPNAKLTGLDVSEDMLQIARKNLKNKNVELFHGPYQKGDSSFSGKVDAILFSYSLTMINPQWKDLIQQAYEDLNPGGIVALVDFHNSPLPFFKRHMGNHHVRMDSHLLPELKETFSPISESVKNAYLGFWQYVLFVGKKA